MPARPAGYNRTMADHSFKNTLPRETDDHPDSGMPRQLRTQADNETPLTRSQADAGGVTQPVYGEASGEPDEQKDQFEGTESGAG